MKYDTIVVGAGTVGFDRIIKNDICIKWRY
ncbi:Uncharacterised protein [uncultured archaeon]|nr:Uncharacterised protein [uncultured archaeon]